MREIILSVIGSWQVWVVTIVLVIYISLVRYVARLNKSSYHPAPAPRPKKEKVKANALEMPAEPSKTDDLGLEEGAPIEEE